MISAVLMGLLVGFLLSKAMTSENDGGLLGWGFLAVIAFIVGLVMVV